MTKLKKKNWQNILFLTITPIVGIFGTIILCMLGSVHWPTWILALVMASLASLSITGGYHRAFSHKSYRCKRPLRLIYLLLGSATFEGSALEWCTDHRNHHRYADTDKDKYSIKKGFWHAHIGWLFVDNNNRDFSVVSDLMRDPLFRWQHKFFVPIAITTAFLLPMALASFWGDPWGGLIIAGALRLTFNMHSTFAINSVCHKFGKKNYSHEETAVDNWLTALFTFGEGYHNFHHKFPIDYRNGVKVYHFDPTKWLIKALSYLGLASDLRVVSKRKIIAQELLAKEQLIFQAINKQRLTDNLSDSHSARVFEQVRQSTQQILSKIEQLEQHYSKLLKDKIKGGARKERKPHRRELQVCRRHIKMAYQELRGYLKIWRQLSHQWQYMEI